MVDKKNDDETLIIIPDFMLLVKIIFKHGLVTLADINFETQITYAHLHKLKRIMMRKGWIEEITRGVNKYVKLTPKGLKVAASINILLQILEISDEEIIKYRRVKRTKNRKKEELKNKIIGKANDEVITI